MFALSEKTTEGNEDYDAVVGGEYNRAYLKKTLILSDQFYVGVSVQMILR